MPGEPGARWKVRAAGISFSPKLLLLLLYAQAHLIDCSARFDYRLIRGIEIKQHDLEHVPAERWEDCPGFCDSHPDCRAWTFTSSVCWLKDTRDYSALVRRSKSADELTFVAGVAAPTHPYKPLTDEEIATHETPPSSLSPDLGSLVANFLVPATNKSWPFEMWYELRETREGCVKLCMQREVRKPRRSFCNDLGHCFIART